MLVLEGSDLSGKTTLAKVLKTWKPTSKPIHFTQPPAGTRHWEAAKAALLQCDQHTIFDRMVLSSWVFRQAKPDEHNITGVTQEELERWQDLMFQLPSTWVIQCVASPADLIKRFDSRGETYLDANELAETVRLYTHAFDAWDMRLASRERPAFLTYNSSYRDPMDFIETHKDTLHDALQPRPPFKGVWQELIEKTMPSST